MNNLKIETKKNSDFCDELKSFRMIRYFVILSSTTLSPLAIAVAIVVSPISFLSPFFFTFSFSPFNFDRNNKIIMIMMTI